MFIEDVQRWLAEPDREELPPGFDVEGRRQVVWEALERLESGEESYWAPRHDAWSPPERVERWLRPARSDLVVRNESADPLLAREGSLWLVECKNGSAPVDPQVVTSFRSKLRDRYQRVRLGIFVAASGFTKNVEPVLLRQTDHAELVVPITGEQLNAWIEAADRVAWLKTRIEEGVLRAAGG